MRTAFKITFAGVTLAANAFLWLTPHGAPDSTSQAGLFNSSVSLDTSQVVDKRPETSIAYESYLAASLGRVNVAHLQFERTHGHKSCGDICLGA